MDGSKSTGGAWGWIFGILLGMALPAVGSFFLAVFWFKKPEDHLFNMRAGFFGCLLSAGALCVVGARGWQRSMFSRGLAVGSGLWLAWLPFLAGPCLR